MESQLLLLFLSLLPVVLLLWFFYHKDKYQKERKGTLAEVFLLSAFITIPLAIFIQVLLGFLADTIGIAGILFNAFISAALTEEFLKYIIVKEYAYSKTFFNEVYDGIVYCVVASLGFAAVENLLYIFDSDGGLSTALIRAFTAVPAHALDGAVLGYFLGLSKFANSQKERKALIIKGLLWAILFHGFYDLFLFTESLAALLIFPLIYLQARCVFIAIKNSHKKNPPKALVFNFKELFIGVGIWQGIQFIVGATLLIIDLLAVIGIGLSISEGEVIEHAGGMTIFVGLFFLLGFWLVHRVYRIHKKALLIYRGSKNISEW